MSSEETKQDEKPAEETGTGAASEGTESQQAGSENTGGDAGASDASDDGSKTEG